MSESNQSYKELAIPHFKEVFDIIDEMLNERDIPYYLIGVSAIALEMLKKGIKSTDLNERIQSLLEKNTSDPTTSNIAKIWARDKGWDLEYCLLLLTAFKTGIGEGEK